MSEKNLQPGAQARVNALAAGIPEALLHPRTQQEYLNLVALGKTARSIRQRSGIDASSWDAARLAAVDPSFRRRYRRALEAGTHALAESAVDAVDEYEDPQRARIYAENARWLASKRNPRQYGDALQLNVSDDVQLRDALAAAKGRVLEGEAAQVADSNEETRACATDKQSAAHPLDEENAFSINDLLK